MGKQRRSSHAACQTAWRRPRWGARRPALVLADAAQGAQQFFVGPAQFFGVRVGLGAGLAVVGQRFGGQVVLRGVGHQAGVEAVALAALVEHGQVVVGAVLVHAANAAQRAFGQTLGLEEDGFVLRLAPRARRPPPRLGR
jgi:hypothetical protein